MRRRRPSSPAATGSTATSRNSTRPPVPSKRGAFPLLFAADVQRACPPRRRARQGARAHRGPPRRRPDLLPDMLAPFPDARQAFRVGRERTDVGRAGPERLLAWNRTRKRQPLPRASTRVSARCDPYNHPDWTRLGRYRASTGTLRASTVLTARTSNAERGNAPCSIESVAAPDGRTGRDRAVKCAG